MTASSTTAPVLARKGGAMLPRFTIVGTSVALLISIITGLYHRFSTPATQVPVPVDIVIAKADTASWNLGTEHAVAFVRECTDDDARGLRLLDIRARESNIRARISDAAADAYVAGFEYQLRQQSDSLARIILKTTAP